EQADALRTRLLAAQNEVAQREGTARVAEAERTAAEQRLAQAARLLGEARAAAQTLAATRADHDTYLRSERARALALQRAQQRDTLATERGAAAQEHERAESDTRHANARLGEIALAEQRITALQAALTQQSTLEHARDEARQNGLRLRQAQEALGKLGKQRAAIEHAASEREREAAEIETARPLAAARDERQRRVEGLQQVAATRQQHQQRSAAIGVERAEVAARRAGAAEMQVRQQQNLRKLEGYRSLVESLPTCEREQQAADQAAREIETQLSQHRQARELSGVGHCPFLREPCKNIQQRGENNLATYFDRLISDDERVLAPAQAQRTAAMKQVAQARKAAEVYAGLEGFNGQLQQATEVLAACDVAERRLSEELAAIAQALAAAGDVAGLAEAKRLLRESEEADKRLATAPGVQRALEEYRERLSDLSEDWTKLVAERAMLAGAPEAERAALAALTALGDPRNEVAGKQSLAAERPAVERLLTLAREQSSAAEATLARLDALLAPFAALNDELATLAATLEQTGPGHTRYLQHERAAAQLDEREHEHAAAATHDVATATAAQLAAEALAASRARFDAQALAAVSRRAEELGAQRGQLRETKRHIEASLAELAGQIAQGEQKLAELERARAERDELSAMQKMLDHFREMIKEAGPLVTQRLLKDISAQANAIFGEIIGDHAAELAWQDEYEIVLKRGSNTRTFALLSGGEQMAAALATRLALLRRLTGLDLAFFDEPTQNMDSERRSALAEQIRRVRGFEQLIVISHDDTFEQGLDSVIHLEKRDGATEVRADDASFAAPTPFADDLDGHDDRFGDRFGERLGERLGADLSALLAE
ncbi:MAG TPA: hypothetical protein VIC27_10555, partial [Ktedonobacterales bacterium]